MKEQLHIKRDCRTLNLRGNTLHKKNYVIISCTEHWESDDSDFGEDEHDHASFFLTSDDIDQLIKKLKEAKEFIKKPFDS